MTDAHTTPDEAGHGRQSEAGNGRHAEGDRGRDGTTEPTPVATLDGVTRTYGGIVVLDDVSLSIRPGVTAVVGPNGSGKSTLLGTLAEVTLPVDGAVDRPTETDDRGAELGDSAVEPSLVRRVGYLPQRVPFRESFTARETLAFYARLVGDDPDAALESVGLKDASDRRVGALSGGMRRLLGIAQATIGDPPLVVLDEPASGLDPGMRERAFRLAAENAAGGTAVVVSSHDLDLVDRYADRAVVLDRGTVVAAGPIGSLYAEYDVDSVEGLYRAAIHGTDSESAGDAPDERAVHVTGVSE
ncbi:ABC transporter ATP-binding protein [Halorubrum tibetense]|uniref:ABC transporter ATP-binding protein n=1 Tax=Halorubrum tibetense TaxID=175631 RepID=A0ABD5S6S8_9EURY